VKYPARLEVLSEASAIRTPVVDGVAALPQIGQSFYILAVGLTPGLPYRHVFTSEIIEMVEESNDRCRRFVIRTKSGSIYALTLWVDTLSDLESAASLGESVKSKLDLN